MGLLEALHEIREEGLINCYGLCMTVLVKTDDKEHLDDLIKGKADVDGSKDTRSYPIYVEGYEDKRDLQYHRMSRVLYDSTKIPPYHTEYRAQRWYLLHQLINELELK